MAVAELTEDAREDQFQTTLAVGHSCQGGVFGFVFKNSLEEIAKCYHKN